MNLRFKSLSHPISNIFTLLKSS